MVGSALFALLLAVTGVLLFWSYPGRPEPYPGADGKPLPSSVSEKIWVEINGVRQGMFIKGKDTAKPVLLYLHGGMPDYFLAERSPTGLDELFTVCWWEQRGSGISYRPDILPETLTVEQLVADTLEVTNYLRRRFGQEKIYLMGHSGGTFLGIHAVARAPQLYHAYIGVAQMANQLESEKLAYDFMLQRYRELGDASMVRKLEAAPVTLEHGAPVGYLRVRDEGMHRLGIGTTRTMKSVVDGIFLPSLQSPDYSFGDKINLWRGKAATGVSSMWPTMVATDLRERLTEVSVPVFFFEGVHDYTCSFSLAESYFDKLKAPLKGFYVFQQSAHSPIFEEPAKARDILTQDVLAGRNLLADKK